MHPALMAPKEHVNILSDLKGEVYRCKHVSRHGVKKLCNLPQDPQARIGGSKELGKKALDKLLI